MKTLPKITILTFAMSSAMAFAEHSAQYQDCNTIKDNEKNCLSFQITIPDYPYPWIDHFILPETFDEENLQLNDLQKIVEQYVKSILAETEEGDDQEKIVWSPIEEIGDYLQLSKKEYLKSADEKSANEMTVYYVFNKKDHTQSLSLDNILESENAEINLSEVLKTVYFAWQVKNKGSEEEAKAILENSLENGEMPVSDNWFLVKDSLVFNYRPFEISPNDETINLIVPIQDLEGIIKPDILQAAKQWKTAAKK